MSVEELDGFFTALIAGSATVIPSESIPRLSHTGPRGIAELPLSYTSFAAFLASREFTAASSSSVEMML
jgi:hypothetical protein